MNIFRNISCNQIRRFHILNLAVKRKDKFYVIKLDLMTPFSEILIGSPRSITVNCKKTAVYHKTGSVCFGMNTSVADNSIRADHRHDQ